MYECSNIKISLEQSTVSYDPNQEFVSSVWLVWPDRQWPVQAQGFTAHFKFQFSQHNPILAGTTHFQSTLLTLNLALTVTAIPNPSPPADRIAPAVPAASPASTPTVTPTPSPSPGDRNWPKFQSDPQNADPQSHGQDKGKCPDMDFVQGVHLQV